MVVQIVLIYMEMGPAVEIAYGLKHIRNVYQKVFTLQMLTGDYGVSVGIYGKGL